MSRTKGKKGNDNSDLEKLIFECMALSSKTKECCRAFTIQAMHSPDINEFAKCVRSCMETEETADLCLLFLSNSSPNTKECLRLTRTVVGTTLKECIAVQSEQNQNMITFCTQILKKYIGCLGKLERAIRNQ